MDRQYYYLGGFRAMMYIDGHPIVFDTRDTGMLFSLISQKYEPTILQVLMQNLQPNDCYIDVGANVGMHALRVNHKLKPDGLMYCFEPNPEIFQVLSTNIHLNGGFHNVRIRQAAVYDSPGKVQFSHDRHEHRVGAIVLPGATNYGDGSYEVECITLDSLDVEGRDVVIKIDVEGREGGVIAGGRKLFKERVKLAVMEYHRSVMISTGTDVDQLLKDFSEWGFEPFVCGPNSITPCSFAELARMSGHFNIAFKRLDKAA